MSVISNEIASLQNMTAYNKTTTDTTQKTTENDSNMFLTLMLEQLKSQDPTQPTDNTEWLSQLAQYSSLEQMTQMNEGLEGCMNYIAALYSDMVANAEVTQTLSMIGKEVTLSIEDPENKDKTIEITGTVTEASFEDGTGKVKVNGEYYSIANIISIREKGESSSTEENTTTAQNK